jgi:hypothetical protein
MNKLYVSRIFSLTRLFGATIILTSLLLYLVYTVSAGSGTNSPWLKSGYAGGSTLRAEKGLAAGQLGWNCSVRSRTVSPATPINILGWTGLTCRIVCSNGSIPPASNVVEGGYDVPGLSSDTGTHFTIQLSYSWGSCTNRKYWGEGLHDFNHTGYTQQQPYVYIWKDQASFP